MILSSEWGSTIKKKKRKNYRIVLSKNLDFKGLRLNPHMLREQAQ
jgi:hypothetical protein